jgi:hypothetical protein
MNCVRCPTCSADDDSDCYWISLPDRYVTTKAPTAGSLSTSSPNIDFTFKTKKRMKVDCPRCMKDFCSQCLTSPYHHHCDCEELINYTRAWVEWLGGKQNEYLEVHIISFVFGSAFCIYVIDHGKTQCWL